MTSPTGARRSLSPQCLSPFLNLVSEAQAVSNRSVSPVLRRPFASPPKSASFAPSPSSPPPSTVSRCRQVPTTPIKPTTCLGPTCQVSLGSLTAVPGSPVMIEAVRSLSPAVRASFRPLNSATGGGGSMTQPRPGSTSVVPGISAVRERTRSPSPQIRAVPLPTTPVPIPRPTVMDLPAAVRPAFAGAGTASMVQTCPMCGERLRWSDYEEERYAGGWRCQNFHDCGSSSHDGCGKHRWFCHKCEHDLCHKCAHGEQEKAHSIFQHSDRQGPGSSIHSQRTEDPDHSKHSGSLKSRQPMSHTTASKLSQTRSLVNDKRSDSPAYRGGRSPSPSVNSRPLLYHPSGARPGDDDHWLLSGWKHA